MMRGHLDGHDDVAKPALGERVNDPDEEPAERPALIARRSWNAGHKHSFTERDLLTKARFTARWEGSFLAATCRGAAPAARCSTRAATLPMPARRCDSGGLPQTWDRP